LNVPSSCGVDPTASVPASFSRDTTPGSFIALATSAASLSMIGFGVAAGA
jgi:hypothetical protein